MIYFNTINKVPLRNSSAVGVYNKVYYSNINISQYMNILTYNYSRLAIIHIFEVHLCINMLGFQHYALCAFMFHLLTYFLLKLAGKHLHDPTHICTSSCFRRSLKSAGFTINSALLRFAQKTSQRDLLLTCTVTLMHYRQSNHSVTYLLTY